MEYSHANVGQKPLDEYVDVVAKIYSEHDKNRSIWDIWCHTLHHAAGIAEQIRLGATGEGLRTEIADFSLWLFTAILKFRGKFGESKDGFEGPYDRFVRIQSPCTDLLWQKYPKACPSCSGLRIASERTDGVGPGHLNPCECPAQRPEAEDPATRRKRITALRNYSDEIRGEKPISIDDWQKMFGTVFESNLKALSLTDIGLHLMEELGEASDAIIRMYTYGERTFVKGEPNWRQSDLEGELADVISWLFALVEKLDSLRRNTHTDGKNESEPTVSPVEAVRLSAIIWERYGSDALNSFHCQKCKSRECHCEIILVPATRSTEELLEKFQ
jgi:NTP pyrophosphatase (non-canonical NTP hydrolase)